MNLELKPAVLLDATMSVADAWAKVRSIDASGFVVIVIPGDDNFYVWRVSDLRSEFDDVPSDSRQVPLLSSFAVTRGRRARLAASLEVADAGDIVRRGEGVGIAVEAKRRDQRLWQPVSDEIVLDEESFTVLKSRSRPPVDAFDIGALSEEASEAAEPEEAAEAAESSEAAEEPRTAAAPEEIKPPELYPKLEMPERAAADRSFMAHIGFRADLDPTLEGGGRISFPKSVRPGETCLIRLVGVGLTIDGEQDFELPLQVVDREVSGRLDDEVDTAELKALYYFRGDHVATARRLIRAAGSNAVVVPAEPHAVSIPQTGANGADMTVNVTSSGTGELQWNWSAPALGEPRTGLRTQFANARDFAVAFAKDVESATGFFASNALGTRSREICDCIPLEFFDDLRKLHEALGRIPSLLFISNENTIPWELAEFDPPLDSKAPKLLAAQVDMGRWMESRRAMMPPPPEARIAKIYAVAGTYGLATNLPDLKWAKQERADLARDWAAVALEADRDVLENAFRTAEFETLIHFAVHGLSDPQANTQQLIINKNVRLSASSLGVAYKPGDTPKFSFVFLNACQVGTPGESLGQTEGFPGVMVTSGVRGFVAPLWKVNDEIAHRIATDFYSETIGKGATVGKTLRLTRAQFPPEGNLTWLSYVYYGHPNANMKRLDKPA